MKRLAFNGGEISPSMALRADMDTYARSCSKVTNWNILATGGVTRRHGMHHLATTTEASSRLIPYVYSAEQTYLVELAPQAIRVRRAADAATIATFTPTEDNPWQFSDIARVSWLQINALLIILSPDNPPLQLKCDAAGSWNLTPFEFSTPPWQTEEYRDIELTLTPVSGGAYEPSYAPVLDEDGQPTAEVLPQDTEADTGDILRCSYYTERREAFEKAATAADDLEIISAITSSSNIQPGDKLAWRDASQQLDQLFICTKAWNGSNDFTAGFISPQNYPDNFDRADNSAGFEDVSAITALTAASSFQKGAKIRFRKGYWNLYTCIREFSGEDDFTGSTSPADYPKHFCRGIPIGQALPCGGKWQFYCSGTWTGTYEIRRNFESGALTGQWEHVGESISSIGATANNLITGNEEEKECYLRLFLTQVSFSVDADPAASFPPDYCQNRLIVQPYRHNMQLTTLADGTLDDTSPLVIPLSAPITTTDWSWGAFNTRYGFPTIAALHESRLILAATRTQPQTIWMSQSDDLGNFTTGDLDTSGMLLTMSTSTQAPICWMLSRNEVVMLGTMDAEWIIKTSNGSSGLTPANAKIFNQGRIGSMPIPAVSAADRVLFTERGGGRVYEYGYRYESDSYTSTDLTIFADHIAPNAGGITGGAVLKKPYPAVVFTTGSGQLLIMTYNTLHNVNAWHRYTTQGTVQSAAVLPNGTGPDRLFLITLRNGSRRIELIDQDPDAENPFADGLELYPYTSTLETTAFSAPDYQDRKHHTSQLQAFFSGSLPNPADITISTGGTYKHNDRLTLAPGWNPFTAAANWHLMPFIGIQVAGTSPCTILALQLGPQIST